jgi:carbamoyltransferase
VASSYILGINGGVRAGYQDVAAVLMRDGRVIAAVEEERINRVKHSAGQLPISSIKEVLRIANITIYDVAVVAFHGSTWQVEIEQVIQQHFESYFGFCPTIKRYHHHDCHAASSFFASGFVEALVITIDGSGDGVSTQIAIGRNNKLEVIKQYERPQSLGLFYSMMTQVCGFTRDADEYKLMGLAAFGDYSKVDLNNVLQVQNGSYHLDTDYLVNIPVGQPSPSRYEMLYSKKLLSQLNVSRRVSFTIDEPYKHIAAATQQQLELALTSLVQKHVLDTGINKVCLAGGVALNCLANQKIGALDGVTELFIQPASNDAGIALGAAYLAAVDIGESVFEKQTNVFLGTEFADLAVEEVIQRCQIPYSKSHNPVNDAAAQLAEKKVIGWFQGRMEFGPRALGNRSILANPAAPHIQHTVNHKVKFREGFRPFGASVLEEDFYRYFEATSADAPYMTKVFNVKSEYKELLAGVTHVDGTCRVQTVNRKQNELYYDLLMEFKRLSGFGVLLNTSFNLNHEPIVNTPREAIASFYASGLDTLFLGSFKINK